MVSNSLGSVMSSSATLTVDPGAVAPSITTPPTNQTVTSGQSATFSVVATGTAPLSYQWQKNGANIPSANAASYVTPATTTADNGSTFDVIVSNSVGSVTSSSLTLTVTAAPVRPSITTPPANQTVTAGQSATFSVVANGTAPLSYQWQKNGANISGANAASYVTPATTTADNGSTFDVIVSNSVGSVTSSSATLTVGAAAVPPSITTPPANQTVTSGQSATFSVVATGTAPLSYQWRKNGANIPGANAASYVTPATTTADNGSAFDVIVSNSAGSVTSNAATLTVNSLASGVSSLALNPAAVAGGSSSTGTVTLNGVAPSGGAVVTLSSDNTAAQVPASVTVSAGQSSANFTITTSPVSSSTPVNITASYLGSTMIASLTVNPAPDIAVNATVSVSSENIGTGQLGIKAIDGVIGGCPNDCTNEWATVGELGLRPNSSAYAWIRLDWSYITTSEVDLYDRPNSTDNITSGALFFSDGSSISVGTLPNDGSIYPVTFAPKNISWVQFDIYSAVGSNTGLSEIEVLGSCAVTPSVRVAAPLSEYLQTPTTSLTATAQTCLDPANNAGWGVRFLLDGGPSSGGVQLDTHTAPYQVTFTNLAQSEHTIDAYLLDASNNIVSGIDTHDQVNHIGIGDYFVALGDSISEGIGDDISSDDSSNDGRNGPVLDIVSCACGGGGYEPILNNLRTAQTGLPQTVVNEAVGGTWSIDPPAIINTMLARHPGAAMFLIQYGTNDATPTGGTPSGLNLNPGDAGYSGSFKDNLQQTINAVNAAGKRVALAKAPMALADCPSCTPYSDPTTATKNVMIQEYNQVIDQLVADPANNINVVPPDFYTFFSNNRGDYSDEIHPNGLGYQGMANLWNQALTGH
jgi:lysophospholipase L1-like esterase